MSNGRRMRSLLMPVDKRISSAGAWGRTRGRLCRSWTGSGSFRSIV